MNSIEAFQETLAATGLPPLIGARHQADGFRAEVVTADLGPVRLVDLDTPAGECFRDARSVRAGDEELWQVDLLSRGHVRVEQGRDTTVLGAGDLILLDPARPVRYASTASRHVTMLLPRRSLRLPARDAERLAGTRIPGDRGPGALVAGLARDATRSLTGFRPEEAARSAAAVIELLSVALGARLGETAGPVPGEALRARITGYVEGRLGDPGLGPAQVAAAHHMSVRNLHRLFEDQPLTVAALIRRRRLERCHADLATGTRTVAAAATRWGFTDPAHFSRLFKAAYGYNASALTSSTPARIVNDTAAPPDDDHGHDRHPGIDPRPDAGGLEPR